MAQVLSPSHGLGAPCTLWLTHCEARGLAAASAPSWAGQTPQGCMHRP